MFTESVLRYRASLQGDYEQILTARTKDRPVQGGFRQRVLQGAYISMGLIVFVSLILGTGFGFLIMIL